MKLMWATALWVCLTAFATSAPAQSLSERLIDEGAEPLAVAARAEGNAVRGAILFTRRDLNCSQCHAPQDGQRIGPDLKMLEGEITDAYLVESLLQPSKVIRKGYESSAVLTNDGTVFSGRILKQSADRLTIRLATADVREVTLETSDIERIAPGQQSAMPANLVDQLQNREQFLDLLRYVMELSDQRHLPAGVGALPGGQSVSETLQGITLIRRHNCAACHADDGIADATLTAKQAPDLAWSDGRIDPRYIERFIADPLHVKSGTTMPDVMGRLSSQERKVAAKAITHFLASLSDRSFAPALVSPEAAQRGVDVFHSVGCVACHSPRNAEGQETLAEDSVPLGDLAPKYSVDALVDFLKDPLQNRPAGQMPDLQLTHWEAIDVASYLLNGHAPSETSADSTFSPDVSLAQEGKRLFTELACVQCHSVGPTRSVPNELALTGADVEQGCLSDGEGPWPRFGFASEERQAIRKALTAGRVPLDGPDQISLSLNAYRCLNCHQRDELGGVSEDRNPHFRTSDPNLGPQGRIPPTLTGIGNKLNPIWMRQVLVTGRAIRPYLMTRMPQYGADNVAYLVDLFQQVDQSPAVEHPSFKDEKEMRKVGAEMAGTSGLNCIACHTFQLKQAANMPAVDLTEMAERLKKDWFVRYMRNPQQLSPNTVMPSFWPAGNAMRKDILDGNTALQIEALWQYLLDGRQARAPRGLIREPIELLATDEAVMLRRKFPDIGKRGIGVGYPNQINIAYDAEQMRLASVWKGPFADPAGVWRSQGHGNVRPLGRNVIQFPKGSDLDDTESPWIADDGRPPNHHFKGYTLDDARRPKFHYQFMDIDVHDYLVDAVDEADKQSFLKRTLTLQSDGDDRSVRFRASAGKRIVDQGDGSFLIDDRLRIRVLGNHSTQIVETEDGQQLHLSLQATNAPTELVLHYHWQD